MTSDKICFPPSWRIQSPVWARLVNLGGAGGWVKQTCPLFGWFVGAPEVVDGPAKRALFGSGSRAGSPRIAVTPLGVPVRTRSVPSDALGGLACEGPLRLPSRTSVGTNPRESASFA